MNGKEEHRQEDSGRPKLDVFLDLTIPTNHLSWDHEGTEQKFSLPTGPSTQITLSHEKTKTKAIRKASRRPKIDIMMHSTKPSTQISLSHKNSKTKAMQEASQRPKVDIMMHSTKPSSQPFLNHKQQTKEKVTQENTQETLPKIELFIAILSAPHRRSRRIGLRQTWLSTVHNYPVAFKFFTDGQELSNETKHTLQLEQKKFGDLELLPTRGGYWFSHRLLHALFWANKHYNFKFFLRMDDDYFLCLNHLYNDLQYRKDEKFLYWGWLHCDQREVRIDEGFVVFGVDLVREITRRNNSLLCHPFGDQMVEMLMTRLDREGVKATYFPDNARLMHRGLTLTRVTEDLCRNILAVHKAYPQQMKVLWSVTKAKWFAASQNLFRRVHIKEYHEYCNATRGFDWKALLGTFYGHKPKPCWAPGVHWPMLHKYKVHGGRQRA